jgi:hypothetical protein
LGGNLQNLMDRRSVTLEVWKASGAPEAFTGHPVEDA